MAATEIRNRQPTAPESRVPEPTGKVARQLSEILEEADRRERALRPILAYRLPAPGVRYYF